MSSVKVKKHQLISSWVKSDHPNFVHVTWRHILFFLLLYERCVKTYTSNLWRIRLVPGNLSHWFVEHRVWPFDFNQVELCSTEDILCLLWNRRHHTCLFGVSLRQAKIQATSKSLTIISMWEYITVLITSHKLKGERLICQVPVCHISLPGHS